MMTEKENKDTMAGMETERTKKIPDASVNDTDLADEELDIANGGVFVPIAGNPDFR